jgi:hypothetical protein
MAVAVAGIAVERIAASGSTVAHRRVGARAGEIASSGQGAAISVSPMGKCHRAATNFPLDRTSPITSLAPSVSGAFFLSDVEADYPSHRASEERAS